MTFSPVQTQRRYLHVAQQMLQRIFRGDPAPGARLPSDREIAAQADVSRATAREAVLALELLGVVEVRHGEGAFVTKLVTPMSGQFDSLLDVPRDLIETRVYIEPLVASLAATRIDKQHLTRLHELVEQTAALVDDIERLPEFIRLGLRFHAELAPGCGNLVLADIVKQLADVEEHPMWTLVNQLTMRTREAREAQVNEHADVLEAIARGDPEASAGAMSRHVSALMTQDSGPIVVDAQTD